jgi:uncharacterized protein (TIGR03382 family)
MRSLWLGIVSVLFVASGASAQIIIGGGGGGGGGSCGNDCVSSNSTPSCTPGGGPPKAFYAQQGNNQLGEVGQPLTEELSIRVEDRDCLAVAGQKIRLSITQGDATLSASTITTDNFGFASFTVTMGTTPSGVLIEGTSGGVNNSPVVWAANSLPGPAVALELGSVPTDAQTGQLFDPAVIARDQFGNIATGYTGTIHFSSSDSAATLPADFVFLDGFGGVQFLGGAAFATEGTQSFTVEDTVDPTLTSTVSGIVVSAPPPVVIAIDSGNGQSGVVGTDLGAPLVVQAIDSQGQPVADVAVSWSVTQGDGAVSTSSSITGADGRAQITATLGSLSGVATHRFTAETPDSSVTFTASADPGPGVALDVQVDPGVLASVATGVRVTALDAFNNVATSYQGTISFGSSDTGANLPADTTFDPAANGVVTLPGSVKFSVEGTQTLDATDIVDITVTGTAIVDVGPAPRIPDANIASGDGQTGVVGEVLGAPLVIQIVDQFGVPMAGESVAWLVETGAADVTAQENITDAGGFASALLTAGTAPGNVTVSATTSDAVLVFGATTVAGPTADLVLIADDGESTACGEEGFTLSAVDAFGNPSSDTVDVTLAAGAGSGAPIITSTTLGSEVLSGPIATGQLTTSARVFASLDDAADLTLSWTSPALAGGASTATFLVGPVDATASLLSSDVSEVSSDGLAASMTVTPRDACGVDVGTGVGVVLAASYGTITSTTDLLDGTYLGAFSIGEGACQATPAIITATVEGVLLDQTVSMATVCPAPPGFPVIAPIANPVATVGVPYAIDDDRRAQVTEGAPVRWSKIAGPDELFIDSVTGFVGWLPAAEGTVRIEIGATNAVGTATHAFDVDVRPRPAELPVADIIADPTIGEAGFTVQADATGSSPATDSEIVTYVWDFGDGTPLAFGAQVQHVYPEVGNFQMRVEVVDATGLTDQAGTPISSRDGILIPPVAAIIASATDGQGTLSVDFSCDCTPGSNDIVAHLWDFGDGSTSQLAQVSRVFSPGSYEVRLMVVDKDGLSATTTETVVVRENENLPPLVSASATPVAGPAPLAVQFFSTHGDLDGVVSELGWDFGEGGSSSEPEPSYTFNEPGIYEVRLAATDDTGLVSYATVEIRVEDEQGTLPPRIVSVPGVVARVGEPYRYDDDGSPTARGDNPMAWELGKIVGTELVGAPAGMIVDPFSGEVLWIPTADQEGTVQVALVATNPAGVSIQEFEITVAPEIVEPEPEPEPTPDPTDPDPTDPDPTDPTPNDPGDLNPSPTPAPGAETGCSAAGTNAAPVFAMALLLFLARRRRR